MTNQEAAVSPSVSSCHFRVALNAHPNMLNRMSAVCSKKNAMSSANSTSLPPGEQVQ